jgi:carbonic anhydrase/acetyltransferase-like protein (isoleucine patch superfamily)
MIIGSPAKKVRETSQEEKAFLIQTAKNYVQVGADYKEIIAEQ